MEKILYKIKYLITGKGSRKDISTFFRYASKKEQKAFFLDIIDKANKEQKELVESVKKI